MEPYSSSSSLKSLGFCPKSTLATRRAKVPTVSRLTPVMRAVARMPVPSVRAAMISNCLASSALRKPTQLSFEYAEEEEGDTGKGL